MEADDAQKMRKEDMKNAEKDPDLETFCFDLGKTLPLPRYQQILFTINGNFVSTTLASIVVKATKGMLCLGRGRSRTWVT